MQNPGEVVAEVDPAEFLSYSFIKYDWEPTSQGKVKSITFHEIAKGPVQPSRAGRFGILMVAVVVVICLWRFFSPPRRRSRER